MEYKESNMMLEEDDESASDTELTLLDEDDDLDTWPEELALDAFEKKSKSSPTRFSLKDRRRIEEIQEERRLRKEFDLDHEFENDPAESNEYE